MSKERLVELLKKSRCDKECDGFNNKNFCNGCGGYEKCVKTADYLLANGVIVPPCKIGDTLYRVLGDEITEHEVKNMMYRELQSRWQIDCVPFLAYVGEHLNKSVFRTREEAEAKLKGGAEI